MNYADSILIDRGYPASALPVLRAFFRVGLWHQFMFEWKSLNFWDVLQGYGMLLVQWGIIQALILKSWIGIGVATSGVVACLTAAIGLSRSRRHKQGMTVAFKWSA
ncbi:MAG TPA: hypothetical protein EYQ54_15590 [Myxococcales bacterium]|nr:hypothetical protein [Myxococcales bacterium]HIL81087.1 hypothetical protein [Myxococcales bacterium]